MKMSFHPKVFTIKNTTGMFSNETRSYVRYGCKTSFGQQQKKNFRNICFVTIIIEEQKQQQ